LVLERVVDIPTGLVWIAWTIPEHLKKWFTPAPWTTVDCDIDLRPGGIFRTVMRSPEGQTLPHAACLSGDRRKRKLVWTTALGPGYRPCRREDAVPSDPFVFTAVISLEPQGAGTKYTPIATHADEASCRKHEDMGFHQGWAAALDQLVALAKHM
jgi:uncharacterized protein YndB with AHSA1/START domain